jgi:hypothetical protein
MKAANLLRWYPRAWRDQYGEELLALIQDTLDEGGPTWRLRFSVIWGGLRERAHQARNPSRARLVLVSRWLTFILVGSIGVLLPQAFGTSPPPGRAGYVTAALVVLAIVVAFIFAAVLAGGVAAVPTLVRFLRAGGWPKIRRRVAWAAGVTVPAAAGLTYLVLTSSSQPLAQHSTSVTDLVVFGTTWLALVVAIGLWAAVVAATAKHLTLSPRVRAAELVLGAVIPAAVSVLFSASVIWLSAAQGSVTWLVIGVANLVVVSATAPDRIRQAVRRGRRLRAAASGGPSVNPSA